MKPVKALAVSPNPLRCIGSAVQPRCVGLLNPPPLFLSGKAIADLKSGEAFWVRCKEIAWETTAAELLASLAGELPTV